MSQSSKLEKYSNSIRSIGMEHSLFLLVISKDNLGVDVLEPIKLRMNKLERFVPAKYFKHSLTFPNKHNNTKTIKNRHSV